MVRRRTGYDVSPGMAEVQLDPVLPTQLESSFDRLAPWTSSDPVSAFVSQKKKKKKKKNAHRC